MAITRSIVLTGPRCSGKTAVGGVLNILLDLPVVDCDREFTQVYGEIKDFIKQFGWEKFREKETSLIEEICQTHKWNPIILTPGGEAVAHSQGEQYRARNVSALKSFGTVFYLLPYPDLKQSARIIAERMLGDSSSSSSRPALTENSDAMQEMVSILQQRHAIYQAVADHTIYTENLRPQYVGYKICDNLGKRF